MIIPDVYEAFVYLWYDALNKMYYIGSRKGKPDGNYAHSSKFMESFKMNTKPPYMHRKILAYGSYKDMLVLEGKLQENRKKRCWDIYYNDVICDGIYRGFPTGEKHPNYGVSKYGEENPAWGIKRPDLVEYNKNRALTGVTRGKNNPFYGKKHTEESKRKMSASSLGRPNKNKGKGMSREEKLARRRQRYQAKKKQQGQGTLEQFL
jgi:hypothetical protein